MKSEESAYDKRKEESEAAGVKENEIRPPRGGDPPPTGGRWEWTLNWDPVVFDASASPPAAIESPTDAQLASSKLVIGSCPRSPADVDRLIDEGGVEAIICLQCTLCHDALEIDWEPIRRRALDRDVPIVRVAVRDFDRLDQAKMLPEMVRKLALFQAMGKRTYVHCTAGINRASLTVLGYLTFCKARPLASMTPVPVRPRRRRERRSLRTFFPSRVCISPPPTPFDPQGMSYEDAHAIIRRSRPQANPYQVSWDIARSRLLAERLEDIYLYTQVDGGGNSIDQKGDWIKRDVEAAEIGVIRQIFERGVEADLGLVSALCEMGCPRAEEEKKEEKKK
jgi:hypothetical protein